MNDEHRVMRICHVAPSINMRTGGVAYSVASLTNALVGSGIKVDLFSLDYEEHGEQISLNGATHHAHQIGRFSRKLRGYHPQLFSELDQFCCAGVDLLHNHGLWMYPNIYARRVATGRRIPLITSVRGMLEAWSLGRSRVRKFFAWHVYEKTNLQAVSVFHATSGAEVESIRRLGFKQPVALIPNGVDLLSRNVNRTFLENRFPQLGGKRWILFLSRIDPKKGLDDLLRVWNELPQFHADWHMIIAGPDLVGWQRELEDYIRQRGLQESVTFTGMLSGKSKVAAFRGASVFVLPTYSENFGVVVAEALAHGVPVITTKNAPWQALLDTESGWWIEGGRETLRDSLQEALLMSDEELRSMGEKGREYVLRELSWKTVAERMLAVYLWILDRGSQPEVIELS